MNAEKKEKLRQLIDTSFKDFSGVSVVAVPGEDGIIARNKTEMMLNRLHYLGGILLSTAIHQHLNEDLDRELSRELDEIVKEEIDYCRDILERMADGVRHDKRLVRNRKIN